MRQESQQKHDQIICAAIKRFAHFGVNKTSMAEIADDVSITKQSLTYYFPDKQHLVTAVQVKLVDEYFELLENAFNRATDIESALVSLVDIKRLMIEKYFLLAMNADTRESFSRDALAEGREKVRLRATELINQLLEKGIRSGELYPVNVKKTSDLIYTIITALQQCAFNKHSIPDMDMIHEGIRIQKDALHLITNGLKKAQPTNN